jgi:hypothetical protein
MACVEYMNQILMFSSTHGIVSARSGVDFFRSQRAPLYDYADGPRSARVSADRSENEGPKIPAPHLGVSLVKQLGPNIEPTDNFSFSLLLVPAPA